MYTFKKIKEENKLLNEYPPQKKPHKLLNDKDVHIGYGERIKHMETKEKQPRNIRDE